MEGVYLAESGKKKHGYHSLTILRQGTSTCNTLVRCFAAGYGQNSNPFSSSGHATACFPREEGKQPWRSLYFFLL